MSQFTEMAAEWVRMNLKPPLAGPPDNAESCGSLTRGSDIEPGHDPSAWAKDFHLWALSKCVWFDRCRSYIGPLHCDFCEWTIAHESVPCKRQTFEWLLADQGLFLENGCVSGLILRQDLDALGCGLLVPGRGRARDAARGKQRPSLVKSWNRGVMDPLLKSSLSTRIWQSDLGMSAKTALLATIEIAEDREDGSLLLGKEYPEKLAAMLARPVDQLSVVFAKLMMKGIVQMSEHLGGYTLRLQIPKGSTVVNDKYAMAMRETPNGLDR